MKFVRFLHETKVSWGVLRAGWISALEGDVYGQYMLTGEKFLQSEVELMAPLVPNKIIGLSNVNYHSRMEKLQLAYPEQIFFFHKPLNTIIGPGKPIELPTEIKRAAHELELAIVIGKKGKYIPVQSANDHIFGYTLANDITIRDFMVPNMPVGKAKSLDTTTPVGPCIETEVDWDTLRYQLYVSGELRQDVTAGDHIYSPAQIIAELSQIMTLEPGDLIMTGAALNNIEFQIGDTIEIRCEQIGVMTNTVTEAPSRQYIFGKGGN